MYHRKRPGSIQELHRINAKLQPRYVGPFRIIEKISPVLYVANINNRNIRVHAIRMKPAF